MAKRATRAGRILRSVALLIVLNSVLAVLPAPALQQVGQKVIHDPAEYDAYIAGLNKTEPSQKATALEDFLDRYPESVVAVDALEELMSAYSAVQETRKVQETGERMLQLDPGNVRALALLTYLKRQEALQQKDVAAAITELRTYAERGLRQLPHWQQPANMSDADFKKLHGQMSRIFNGAAGFAALQQKRYAEARNYYLESVGIDADDLTDVYQLAITDLEMNPLDVNGFWYIARAAYLARKVNNQAAFRETTEGYGKAKYRQYHGGVDGWHDLLERATRGAAPPHGFTVARAQHDEPARANGVPASITSPDRIGGSHGTPASVSSFAQNQPHGVPASLSSLGNDGTPHGIPASVSSPATDGTPHGVPASVSSPGADGSSHGVPASMNPQGLREPPGVPSSVSSPDSSGAPHGVPASVSSPGPDGTPNGVPSSVSSPTPADADAQQQRLTYPVLFGDPNRRGTITIPIFSSLPKYSPPGGK